MANANIFAIAQIGSHQYKIHEGDSIFVDSLDINLGEEINLKKILLVGTPELSLIGQPVLNNVVVNATILAHTKSKKVTVFKKKRRKGYTRLNSHRQLLTVLKINAITLK